MQHQFIIASLLAFVANASPVNNVYYKERQVSPLSLLYHNPQLTDVLLG